MSYRPSNYAVYNRAWSILFHLFNGLERFTPTVAQEAAGESVSLVIVWNQPRDTNFLPRAAVSDSLMPLFTAEMRRAGRGRAQGVRVEEWEIAVQVQDGMDVRLRGLNADIAAIADDVIGVLDGARIAYYDYATFPVDYEGTYLHDQHRRSAQDFVLKWSELSRGSESDERDRNTIRMRFTAEV